MGPRNEWFRCEVAMVSSSCTDFSVEGPPLGRHSYEACLRSMFEISVHGKTPSSATYSCESSGVTVSKLRT